MTTMRVAFTALIAASTAGAATVRLPQLGFCRVNSGITADSSDSKCITVAGTTDAFDQCSAWCTERGCDCFSVSADDNGASNNGGVNCPDQGRCVLYFDQRAFGPSSWGNVDYDSRGYVSYAKIDDAELKTCTFAGGNAIQAKQECCDEVEEMNTYLTDGEYSGCADMSNTFKTKGTCVNQMNSFGLPSTADWGIVTGSSVWRESCAAQCSLKGTEVDATAECCAEISATESFLNGDSLDECPDTFKTFSESGECYKSYATYKFTTPAQFDSLRAVITDACAETCTFAGNVGVTTTPACCKEIADLNDVLQSKTTPDTFCNDIHPNFSSGDCARAHGHYSGFMDAADWSALRDASVWAWPYDNWSDFVPAVSTSTTKSYNHLRPTNTVPDDEVSIWTSKTEPVPVDLIKQYTDTELHFEGPKRDAIFRVVNVDTLVNGGFSHYLRDYHPNATLGRCELPDNFDAPGYGISNCDKAPVQQNLFVFNDDIPGIDFGELPLSNSAPTYITTRQHAFREDFGALTYYKVQAYANGPSKGASGTMPDGYTYVPTKMLFFFGKAACKPEKLVGAKATCDDIANRLYEIPVYVDVDRSNDFYTEEEIWMYWNTPRPGDDYAKYGGFTTGQHFLHGPTGNGASDLHEKSKFTIARTIGDDGQTEVFVHFPVCTTPDGRPPYVCQRDSGGLDKRCNGFPCGKACYLKPKYEEKQLKPYYNSLSNVPSAMCQDYAKNGNFSGIAHICNNFNVPCEDGDVNGDFKCGGGVNVSPSCAVTQETVDAAADKATAKATANAERILLALACKNGNTVARMKNGICPTGTHTHLPGKRACEAAANNLNMGTKFIKATAIKASNKPKGCFTDTGKDNKLYFNKVGKTDVTWKRRQAICCGGPDGSDSKSPEPEPEPEPEPQSQSPSCAVTQETVDAAADKATANATANAERILRALACKGGNTVARMKNGICPSGTHAHITNKRACEAAANNLNMGTKFIKATFTKASNKPKGCFTDTGKDNKLYFNKVGKTDVTWKRRQAICCEKPEYSPSQP